MKTIINKILYWLKYSIIALMLALVVLLSALHFASPLLENYRSDFERFVSNIVHQPVKIGEISIRSRGLEPVIRFYNVVILNNDKSKKLLQAQELQIGIDLIGSLFKLRIKPGLILIRGSKFTVYQTEDGKISVAGVSLPSDTVSNASPSVIPGELFSWLFEQVKIDLEDIALKWHLTDGSMVNLTELYLKIHNGVLRHNLHAGGKIKQKHSPAIFEVNLKLHGNLPAEHLISPIVGEIVIENWFSELTTGQFSWNGFFMPPAGNISLSVRNSHITPKLFRQPILMKNFDSKIIWQRNNDGLKIDVSNLDFKDNWLSLSGGGECWFPVGSEMPIVDIKLGFKLVNLAKAKLYYPAILLPLDATAWLDKAFIDSDLITGDVILHGPLDKFPFDNNEGKFLVTTNLRNVDLNYDAAWPRIENINGKMVFANRSLTILANSAQIVHEPVKSVKVTIQDLNLPILNVVGVMDADSSSGLKFISLSPLKNSIGSKLQSINLMGRMKFGLKMRMPLSDDVLEKNTKVAGDIELHDNKMLVAGWNFELNNLTGKLSFSDSNLTAKELHGKLFDKPIGININTLNADSDDAVTQVKIAGSVGVQDFEQAFAINLSPYVSGSFNYNALLELHNISVQNIFKLNSDLHGVTVDLPEPFAKKLASDYKFNLICYFGGNKIPQVLINYNDQINFALLVKDVGSKSLQILAGGIKFGTGVVEITPTSGLMVSGTIAKLVWPIWKEYLTKAKTNFMKTGLALRQISLNIGELHALGQVVKNASLKLLPKKDGWEVTLLTPMINGKIEVSTGVKAPIQGVFKKLHIDDKGQKSLAILKPKDLLALNFKIDDFCYGGRCFHGVEFVAERQPTGLKINRLVINEANYHVEADGEWMVSAGGQLTTFRGNASSSNVGELLKQWELTDNLVGGSGLANFILKWEDPLYKLSLQKASGALTMHINGGRIINLSKKTEDRLSFGRVLNMLSLQTLPQRLTLDFSDLHQGFIFNIMDGEFELNNGNALVKKLILEGQLAYIKAHGRIGLKAKDYDMMLSAVPHHITSSILPVTGAITGGPVGGILGFIADKMVSSGIKKVVTNTYHITGGWDNPKIEKA